MIKPGVAAFFSILSIGAAPDVAAQVVSESGSFEFLGVDADAQVDYQLFGVGQTPGVTCERTGTIWFQGVYFEDEQESFTLDCDGDVSRVNAGVSAGLWQDRGCFVRIDGGVSAGTGLDDFGTQSGRASIGVKVKTFVTTRVGSVNCFGGQSTWVRWNGTEGSAVLKGPLGAPGLAGLEFEIPPTSSGERVFFGFPNNQCGSPQISSSSNGAVDGYLPPGLYELELDVAASFSNLFVNPANETVELNFVDVGSFPPDCMNIDQSGGLFGSQFRVDAIDVCAWYASPSDTNGDGAVNELDRLWLEYIVENQDLPPAVLLADLNDDWEITPADFNAWILAFNTGLPRADQNGDDVLTPADFNSWILNYNAGTCEAAE